MPIIFAISDDPLTLKRVDSLLKNARMLAESLAYLAQVEFLILPAEKQRQDFLLIFGQ